MRNFIEEILAKVSFDVQLEGGLLTWSILPTKAELEDVSFFIVMRTL